jgi:hypothetical protein
MARASSYNFLREVYLFIFDRGFALYNISTQ